MVRVGIERIIKNIYIYITVILILLLNTLSTINNINDNLIINNLNTPNNTPNNNNNNNNNNNLNAIPPLSRTFFFPHNKEELFLKGELLNKTIAISEHIFYSSIIISMRIKIK